MNIQQIIKEIYSNREPNESLLNTHIKISNYVQEYIDPNKIPLLTKNNYQQIPYGTLVRLDCMVQDIFDREIELLNKSSTQCNLYGATSNTSDDTMKEKFGNENNELVIDNEIFDHATTLNLLSSNNTSLETLNGTPNGDSNGINHDFNESFNESIHAHSEYMDIDILYTVPIPGLNQRNRQDEQASNSSSREILNQSFTQSSLNQDKFSEFNRFNNEEFSNINERKRKRNFSEMEDSTGNTIKKRNYTESTISDGESMEIEDTSQTQNINGFKINLYIPAENQTEAFPAIVKVYHEPKRTFKLSSIISVLGILSQEHVYFEPRTSELNPFDIFHQEELSARLPSNNLVPRIYALSITNYDSVYTLYKTPYSSNLSINIELIREKLIEYLSTFLRNDRLAAEYLLLHLMSKVFHSSNQVTINKLSLNLHNISTLEAELLLKAIKEITPATVHIPINQETLNMFSFYPKKNHEKNKIEGSMLQLAPGTNLILNETLLQEGEINQQGIDNITSIRKLISQQILQYDFQFDNYDLPVEIPSLILSERKSIFHNDVDVHLSVANLESSNSYTESYKAPDFYDKILNQFIDFIPLFKYIIEQREVHNNILIPEELRHEAQQSFVQLRKKYFEGEIQYIGANDMGRWITLSRSAAASYKSDVVTSGIWKEIMILEEKRRNRM